MCAVAGRDAGLPAAAGGLAALPIRSGSLAGALCLYAVIHLDPERRWDHDVDLTFRFLDPAAEIAALGGAGLAIVARVEREPYAGVEHPSRRCVLLVERR